LNCFETDNSFFDEFEVGRKTEKKKEKLTGEREKKEDEKESGISLEEVVNGGIENGYERNEGGENDLSGEDAVDLADEPPPELVLAEAQPWVERFARFDVELLCLRTCVHLLSLEHLFLFQWNQTKPNTTSSYSYYYAFSLFSFFII